MIDYAVHVDVGFVEHMVPTTSSSYDGVWIWHSPTLAINCYAGGLSLERIVPTGPDTTEIHYMFLFNKHHHHHHQEQEQEHDSSDTSRLAAIRTTTEVPSLSPHYIFIYHSPYAFYNVSSYFVCSN